MPLAITSIAPTIVSSDGGELLLLIGTFDITRAYQVTCGGRAATSGVPGQGSAVYSPDGLTITCFVPALTGDGPYDVTAINDSGTSATLSSCLSVRPPFFCAETFSLRSILPPLYNTGPRNFSELPAAAS